MISVEDARARIAAAFTPLESERISLDTAHGRVLAEDARAQCAHPPLSVSAMDGYALRADDARDIPAILRIAGTSPAGNPFQGTLGAREAVRIFTGGAVPDGADAVVIQEDADATSTHVTVKCAVEPGCHIRKAGGDFKLGDVLVPAGERLGARGLALIAAGDNPKLTVRRKPRVAFAATGDELSRPGEPRKLGNIIASSGYGLSAMIENWGGIPVDLGILPDTVEAFAGLPAAAKTCDLLITLGGASVGDHDLVQRALEPKGFALDFWKVAMRPGKPLIFGRLGETAFFGLPGNPVSSLVCAILFVKTAICALLGTKDESRLLAATLARDLPANDGRQDYIRTRIIWRDGHMVAEPFATQDSSMLSIAAAADGLIVRAPRAPAAAAGERVDVLPFTD